MSFSMSFAAKSSCFWSLVAVVDPAFLSLFGCVIIVIALLVTWRPMPKSRL